MKCGGSAKFLIIKRAGKLMSSPSMKQQSSKNDLQLALENGLFTAFVLSTAIATTHTITARAPPILPLLIDRVSVHAIDEKATD